MLSSNLKPTGLNTQFAKNRQTGHSTAGGSLMINYSSFTLLGLARFRAFTDPSNLHSLIKILEG